jgi:hypothetical protein
MLECGCFIVVLWGEGLYKSIEYGIGVLCNKCIIELDVLFGNFV